MINSEIWEIVSSVLQENHFYWYQQERIPNVCQKHFLFLSLQQKRMRTAVSFKLYKHWCMSIIFPKNFWTTNIMIDSITKPKVWKQYLFSPILEKNLKSPTLVVLVKAVNIERHSWFAFRVHWSRMRTSTGLMLGFFRTSHICFYLCIPIEYWVYSF